MQACCFCNTNIQYFFNKVNALNHSLIFFGRMVYFQQYFFVTFHIIFSKDYKLVTLFLTLFTIYTLLNLLVFTNRYNFLAYYMSYFCSLCGIFSIKSKYSACIIGICHIVLIEVGIIGNKSIKNFKSFC